MFDPYQIFSSMLVDVLFSLVSLSFSDPKVPKDFNAVFIPIEESIVPMNYAFNTIQMLSSTTWSERSMKAFERVSEEMPLSNFWMGAWIAKLGERWTL